MGLFKGHSSAPLSLGMMLWGSEYFDCFSQWRSPSLEFLITVGRFSHPRKKKSGSGSNLDFFSILRVLSREYGTGLYRDHQFSPGELST